MTILIVDDEALSVEGIAAALPWESLGIRTVLKAYSLKQAQNIFDGHSVDILLCDIEMPRGSGIELMQWIRDRHYDTVCIFLTSYSNFDYASSAVRLQMFDYVLKPCEYTKLADVISRAAAAVRENRKKRYMERSGEYWNGSVQERLNQFWNDLLLSHISSDRSAIAKELEWRHLDPTLSKERYYLLLFLLLPGEEMRTWSDESSWNYAMSNIIGELLFATPAVAYENSFSVIVPEARFPQQKTFVVSCAGLINTLSRVIPAEFIGYCAPACAIEELRDVGQALRHECLNRYAAKSTLFVLGQTYLPRPAPGFSTDRWQAALLSSDAETILNDLNRYFHAPCPDQYYERELLLSVYYQLLKVVFDTSELLNLPEEQRNLISRHQDKPGDALRSIPDFLHWAESLTRKAADLIASRDPSAHVIEALTTYIREHLDSDLNRAELTQVVHLHPDYLSALFRQKTGLSLSEYITRKRMRMAKKLLLSTDLPVNEVAIRTGFSNISYFSRQFRRLEGLTPNQFRKKGSATGSAADL